VVSIILDSISSSFETPPFVAPSKSHVCSWWKSCYLALWNCLIWFSHRRSLAWRRGSSTEIFIAAAYLEFFEETPQSGPIPSGFIRWIIYQCWPVWSSYIVLMTLILLPSRNQDIPSLSLLLKPYQSILGVALSRDSQSGSSLLSLNLELATEEFVILVLVWFLLSCLFLISSYFTTKRWIIFHQSDMIKLFPWMKNKRTISAIIYNNYIPLRIQSIRIGIPIILTLFTSTLMLSIRILHHYS
jgi:hypothetical protein